MLQAPEFFSDIAAAADGEEVDLSVSLPDPEDDRISEPEFQQQVETAWQVCDRFDLQTDIWRGRILRAVRDREKQQGEGRGTGFLNWLRDREITKSQAYSWIELANSADTLLENGFLESSAINRFSKRAFVETAQAPPEVQQMICDLAQEQEDSASPRRITRREVRQLADEWTALASDLLPEEIREKAATNVIPTRYVAPFVREMEKLPEPHQVELRRAVAADPSVDNLKQVTAEARYLARYLAAAVQVQTLDQAGLNLEAALEEALRLGCLNGVADLVNHASQLEQTTTRLYTLWKRLIALADRLYLDSGASTPHLRSLLEALGPLSGDTIQVRFGNLETAREIRLQVLDDGYSELK
ncbi:hypothetical protein BST81_23305 [Leptolyngbya sp. 'hensonii']|uniref:hypothetical protein n=1 Tax=Leptolyngbya sp. 'hensonii' TaxID=1922337 RepID=UPI00094F9804|nr:hypothetical protein [Leptolyngbya sp. 'hensonii']OLP15991.1 hypothetical protein BST81_23305 [Leptolyngbya sp. 'hensonii']